MLTTNYWRQLCNKALSDTLILTFSKPLNITLSTVGVSAKGSCVGFLSVYLYVSCDHNIIIVNKRKICSYSQMLTTNYWRQLCDIALLDTVILTFSKPPIITLSTIGVSAKGACAALQPVCLCISCDDKKRYIE